jgi:LPXTG-motif cell wall-anchored protein
MIWLAVAGILLAAVAFWFFFKRKEGFQGPPAPNSPPMKLSKEMCDKMLESINQYKKVKTDHPDTEIENLDKTLKEMEGYYKLYACDT